MLGKALLILLTDLNYGILRSLRFCHAGCNLPKFIFKA